MHTAQACIDQTLASGVVVGHCLKASSKAVLSTLQVSGHHLSVALAMLSSGCYCLRCRPVQFLAKDGPAQRQLLQHLADTPEVTSIEPNQVLSVKPVAGVEIAAAAAAPAAPVQSLQSGVAGVQQRVPSWGLDRIDGAMDGTYHYTSNGDGVCVYIVDSGVKKGHKEFGERRLIGAFIRYATDVFGQTDDDRNKHGTHVVSVRCKKKHQQQQPQQRNTPHTALFTSCVCCIQRCNRRLDQALVSLTDCTYLPACLLVCCCLLSGWYHCRLHLRSG
jgi:hypothetical protein